MTKFAYHCSANGEIEEFEPKISSHGKAYVYATPNKSLALVFGVKGHNDFWIHPLYNHENNTCTFIEMSPNALAKYYRNKRAYLYTVKRDEFTETTGWKGEICSPNPVKPLKVEYIEDLEQAILEEQKQGSLTVVPFEQRNNQGKNMDEFFAKRDIIYLLKRNDEEYSQRHIQYMKSLENKEIFSFFKKELDFYLESFCSNKEVFLPENITPIPSEFVEMWRNNTDEKTIDSVLSSIMYAPSKTHQQQVVSEVIHNKELKQKIIFKLRKLNNIVKKIVSKPMETNYNVNTRD